MTRPQPCEAHAVKMSRIACNLPRLVPPHSHQNLQEIMLPNIDHRLGEIYQINQKLNFSQYSNIFLQKILNRKTVEFLFWRVISSSCSAVLGFVLFFHRGCVPWSVTVPPDELGFGASFDDSLGEQNHDFASRFSWALIPIPGLLTAGVCVSLALQLLFWKVLLNENYHS